MGAVTHYIRFRRNGAVAFGTLDAGLVCVVDTEPWNAPQPTGETFALDEVQLLAPCVPSKVIAVGLNYKSHLGGREASDIPPIFLKLPTAITGPGAPIVLPADAPVTHYESEMVIVIGKTAKNVAKADADQYIFGVTCGNDVSAREWQRNDLQWFRAKGTDTFGPIGPVIATGLDYNDLHLEGRLNGETVQQQRTSDLMHDCGDILSFVSQYVTLLPGDVIFTGTPGSTKELNPGDTFEVELEGVGVLSNPVTRAEA